MAGAQAGRVGEAPLARTRARLGAAERLDEQYETDRAVELVSAVIRDRAQRRTVRSRARSVLLRAFQDRLGHATEAVAAYRAALAAVPPRDPADLAGRARAGLRQRSDPTQARAYALSLAGWRAYERGALEAGAHMLDRALALRPADPVTHVPPRMRAPRASRSRIRRSCSSGA